MSKIENHLDGELSISIMSAYSLIIKSQSRKPAERGAFKVRI
ncbi:hypothetical protein CIT292_08265 [Citrobacter youngae ATCC 29220]|uniref:Uncharacterized protein n=1 Tax=Citrobacter youngae ATCC 29220 TaxID=500640 RepID=D4BCQ1_9ENTR|nr:hypothetical protein CIT292_08265 [Citrobacter youngae ATCC 29220]